MILFYHFFHYQDEKCSKCGFLLKNKLMLKMHLLFDLPPSLPVPAERQLKWLVATCVTVTVLVAGSHLQPSSPVHTQHISHLTSHRLTVSDRNMTRQSVLLKAHIDRNTGKLIKKKHQQKVKVGCRDGSLRPGG